MPTKPYDSRLWRQLRPLIAERDGWVCQICHKPVDPSRSYDIDHKISWRAGGSWYDPNNLRLAHPGCNRGRDHRAAASSAVSAGTPGIVYPGPSREW